MATLAEAPRGTFASPASLAVSGREWLALGSILLLAIGLRFWQFSETGVNHFDEGVYVFSALGLSDPSQPQTLFPNQPRFSPPLYFTSVAAVHRLTGMPVDYAATAVSAVAGVLAVLAIWWLGRRWFGPVAGIVGAGLLAGSEYHVLLSRVALTDSLFALWFILAMGLIVEAVRSGHLRWVIAAGIATGLAWNTKYHGWFALLITGAALLPVMLRRAPLLERVKPVLPWAGVAVIAALLYLPWALYVRSSEGVGGIVSYFSTMLRVDWMGNAATYAAQQSYLEGILTRASVPAVLGLALWVDGRVPLRAGVIGGFGVLAVCAALLGSAATALLIGLAGLLMLRGLSGYGERVALAWAGLWVVAAPFYEPYARLLLPLVALAGVLLGAALAALLDRRGADRPRAWLTATVLASVLATIALSTLVPRGGNAWYGSRMLDRTATAMEGAIPAGTRTIVIGEPPLAFYLHTRGRPAFERAAVSTLDTLSSPVYLVTGVYADRAPVLRDALARLAPRLDHLGTFPFHPNDLRLLDDMDAASARRYRQTPDTTFQLDLFRLRSAPASP